MSNDDTNVSCLRFDFRVFCCLLSVSHLYTCTPTHTHTRAYIYIHTHARPRATYILRWYDHTNIDYSELSAIIDKSPPLSSSTFLPRRCYFILMPCLFRITSVFFPISFATIDADHKRLFLSDSGFFDHKLSSRVLKNRFKKYRTRYRFYKNNFVWEMLVEITFVMAR